jgi:hypothetical protein
LLRVRVPRWLIAADCVFVALFALLMFGASIGSSDGFGYAILSLLLLTATIAAVAPERRGSAAWKAAESDRADKVQ